MKRVYFFICLFICVGVFQACKSKKVVVEPPSQEYQHPCQSVAELDPTAIFAYGMGVSRSEQMAMMEAQQDAKSNMRRLLFDTYKVESLSYDIQVVCMKRGMNANNEYVYYTAIKVSREKIEEQVKH